MIVIDDAYAKAHLTSIPEELRTKGLRRIGKPNTADTYKEIRERKEGEGSVDLPKLRVDN